VQDASLPLPDLGSAENPVLAAGVVLWTGSLTEPRFLLLQNARHGTWSFAKGHLEAGEGLLDGALREVEEETGIVIEADGLDPVLTDTSIYKADGKIWKRVVYFLALQPVKECAVSVSTEHQASAWLAEHDAIQQLGFSDLRRSLIRAANRLRVLHEESGGE